jgi:hypothetical protein
MPRYSGNENSFVEDITMENNKAKALAFNRVVAKTRKIKELGIRYDMNVEEIDALVIKLATLKAKGENSYEDFVSGQEWYVNDLIRYNMMTAKERLEYEYTKAFGELAPEEDLLEYLEDLVGA